MVAPVRRGRAAEGVQPRPALLQPDTGHANCLLSCTVGAIFFENQNACLGCINLKNLDDFEPSYDNLKKIILIDNLVQNTKQIINYLKT